MMPSAAPSSAMDQNAAPQGGGSDQARSQLEGVMGQIRDFSQKLDEMGGSMPSMAQEVQQIKSILKRMVVKAAQQAPQQTASSQGLPG